MIFEDKKFNIVIGEENSENKITPKTILIFAIAVLDMYEKISDKIIMSLTKRHYYNGPLVKWLNT